MSGRAYEDFRALPVGALFTSTAEWGNQDAFIKVDADRYRRTYDYITWRAAETSYGFGILGGDNWPELRTMDEVPEWISGNPPLTEAECVQRELADRKRVREYVEKTGELPGMGFW